jgi:hypothetical protein
MLIPDLLSVFVYPESRAREGRRHRRRDAARLRGFHIHRGQPSDVGAAERVDPVPMTAFPHPIAWRRLGAPCHYVGTLEVESGALVLNGREPSTGVEARLRVPDYAVRTLRSGRSDAEDIVGVRGYVLELADAIPLLVRASGVGPLYDEELARTLSNALHRAVAHPAAA